MYTYINMYTQYGLGEGWHLGWEEDSIGGCLAVYVSTYMHGYAYMYVGIYIHSYWCNQHCNESLLTYESTHK